MKVQASKFFMHSLFCICLLIYSLFLNITDKWVEGNKHLLTIWVRILSIKYESTLNCSDWRWKVVYWGTAAFPLKDKQHLGSFFVCHVLEVHFQLYFSWCRQIFLYVLCMLSHSSFTKRSVCCVGPKWLNMSHYRLCWHLQRIIYSCSIQSF